MTREQALDILCAFQEWCRYDGPVWQGPLMPNPKEIGHAIGIAVSILRSGVEAPQFEPGVSFEAAVWAGLEKMDIRNEEISVYTANRCRDLGIHTVYDLAGWPKRAIIRQKGFGAKTFREAELVLKKYGLSWGMWESQSYLDYMKEKLNKYASSHV